ncbi:hypothetical protein IscW_ISCW016704 [Ixodes scapularis]|uniref:Uncharacterized protein n=1 Tax=Ixodes scapularis TaxID=6945 RepID=B7PAS8_IXOSC|nr:hypothetical protein IscW_ISCW016704 [Ixodes scapularis]|eukprot:XP_002407144.1 hypothetical protein IscW_ISCW016704 [Ixodes scapularis]
MYNCSTVCDAKYNCDLPSCNKQLDEEVCLLYAGFERTCYVDAQCAIQSRCCLGGYMNCESKCEGPDTPDEDAPPTP